MAKKSTKRKVTTADKEAPDNEAPKPVTSLRERQQQLGAELILEVAFELFSSKGYSKTTVQEIATLAGVGPATVFRHYRSKLGILTALLQQDLAPIFEQGEEIVAGYTGQPLQTLFALLEDFFRILDAPTFAIKANVSRQTEISLNRVEVRELHSFADQNARALIEKLLATFQQHGDLDTALDVGHMAVILFQVFDYHYMELEMNNNQNRLQLWEDLKTRITIILEPWLLS